MELSRDNFLTALAQVANYDPLDFEGLTLPEITQSIALKDLERAYEYMGVEI